MFSSVKLILYLPAAQVREPVIPAPPSWRIKTPGSPSSTTTSANLRNVVRSARRAARWSAWVSVRTPQSPPTQQEALFMLTRVSAGKLCIEVTSQSKIVWISESLCIGCGICIKVPSTDRTAVLWSALSS